MGQKTVRFSDLSGQLITHDDALARIVVHEHPELVDGPVEIEALTDEAEAIEQAALRVAVVDLYLPDDLEPRRIVMEADAFDKLATQNPVGELLISARPARRGSRTPANGSSRGDRVDYGTAEHAGKPHKGKITEAEKQLVRDRFDEINARLARQAITVDMVRIGGAYGSDALPSQPLVDLVELVADQLLFGVGDPALVRLAGVLEGGVVDAIPA